MVHDPVPVSADALLAKGFLKHSDDLYQLRVTDEHGTRYFINVSRWRYRAWAADMYFNDGCVFHPRACLKVQAYSVAEWSVDDIMRWGEELWNRLAPNYYERNE